VETGCRSQRLDIPHGPLLDYCELDRHVMISEQLSFDGCWQAYLFWESA